MGQREIGREFMRITRFDYAVQSDQSLGLPQPPLHRRHHLAGEGIALPGIEALPHPQVDLMELIGNRESVRDYRDAPVSLSELSWLLWATQGVKSVRGDGYCTLRTVPSAGARHPFETYLAVNRVEGLEPGLHQYLPMEHGVAPLTVGKGVSRRIAAASLGQEMPITSAVTFVWTAVPYRNTWRYGQRGYRYMHLDAGHVCQNLYLAAAAIGCGCCAIAAFDDVAMAEALILDTAEEFVIYMATVGKV